MRALSVAWIFLLIGLFAAGMACGCSYNNDTDLQPDDDDDSFPFIKPVEPLNWKRYACSPETRAGSTIITGNYNIHGGREGTPEQIGAELANWGPFDVFSLQECPEEYAGPIADEMSMYYFYADGQSLMSTTPLLNPQRHNYTMVGGRFLHADIEIGGVTFSVYGVHVNWDEVGDIQNRELINDYIAVDPIERIVLMGDWNEELGSTQANILDEQLADAWASLGVCPSCRTTWPAVMFYGAEGQQLIDNTYFNKSSGACTVDGEIIHLSPNRSDHKPQTTTILFPEALAYAPPMLLDVVYGMGAESIGLLFDKPIASAEVELFLADTEIELASQQAIGDGTLYLVTAASVLPTNTEFTAHVVSATDVDGAETTQATDFTFPLYENLLENPGGELCENGWDFVGMEQTTEINHVLPLAGGGFFSGSAGRPRGFAAQDVPLDGYAEIIDAGYGLAIFGGASATGYRVETGGSSNILLPHDEAEGVVEFLDGQGKFLKHMTGGRFDTMYWQPWRVVEPIPPNARIARVVLRAAAAEMPLTFNSASFDALHFSVATLEYPHNLVGPNLVANPLFEQGKQHWNMPEGMILAKDHWIPIRSNIDVNSATGNFWLAALMITPGTKTVSQEIPLSEYEEVINAGELSAEWGAYLRTWNPRSEIVLKIAFFDQSGRELGSEELGPINVPEWFLYSKNTTVPINSDSVRLEWIASTATPVISVAAFFDAPFIYPAFAR